MIINKFIYNKKEKTLFGGQTVPYMSIEFYNVYCICCLPVAIIKKQEIYTYNTTFK